MIMQSKAGKNMRECQGCSQPFRLSDLHIDPQTSDWYCDPCYQMMMLERCDPEPSYEDSEGDEDA